MISWKRVIPSVLVVFMLSGLTVPQAFADSDTSCSGSGKYYLSNGVVFRPSPAPPVQCSG